jgi:hypothetical protein
MMYRETWDADPAWQADLERLAPRSDRVNWLLIHWEPGVAWEPVQRWEIREMIPALNTVPAEMIEEYQGPDPRTRGRWLEEKEENGTLTKSWHSDSLVSHRQWQLFHQTRCHSQRFWIIQGSYGGHRVQLPFDQRRILAGQGRVADTPAPGALPYAEYSSRTFTRIAECDRLQKWKHALGWDQRQERKTDAGLWVKQDRRNDAAEWNTEFLKWWDDQVEGWVRDLPQSAIPAFSDMPRGDTQYNRDEDALDASLVHEED